ncbi:hypothetical protein GCM10029964_112850 [Kibdelosporangium lantanae]
MRRRVRTTLVLLATAGALAVPAASQASPPMHWTLTPPAPDGAGGAAGAGQPAAPKTPGVPAHPDGAGGVAGAGQPAVPTAAQPEAAVDLTNGRLTLTVRRGGTTVLEASALGIETAQGDFTQGLRFAGFSQRTVHETYSTKSGRRLEHTVDAAETTLTVADHAGQKLNVVLRVSADGVAYRYVLDSPNWVTVVREASEFAVPTGADSFLLPYDNGRSDYESAHVHRKVADQDPVEYGYPSLFHVGDTWLLVEESDLNGSYGGSRLRLGDDKRFQLVLPDPAEVSRAPLATPWRTMVIGDLSTVVASDLITDLASPSKVEDTSWVKPGWARGRGGVTAPVTWRCRRSTWTTPPARAGSTTWSTPAGRTRGSRT